MATANGDQIKELFLIDGNSLAYRAFFALPESIATSDGRPTNAIFGFASMLVKILTDHGDVPTVVVWDAGMSGRKDISPDYKAQRSSRPDLLKQQWPHLAPLVDAFGYPNISVEGYEADDVIAALTERARADGIPVMVVTGDRDAYQLVTDGVRIMTTSRGITDTKVYDRQGVIDRYGIPPELVPDFIGLKGDTSDNIPGVPGIGDKTAAELLQRFGSLEEVLANVEQISGAKRKQNLTEFADDARISKRLATMVRDVPVDLDLSAELTRERDRSQLRAIFRDFELRDPLRRLEEALDAAESAAIPRPESESARAVAVRAGSARRPAATDRRGAGAVRDRARGARGRAAAARDRLALRGLRGRIACARRRGRRPGRARRGRGRSPRDRARREGARRGTGQPRRGTPRSPRTCSIPRAAATRSRSSARSAGWPSTPTITRPRSPCSRTSSPAASASRCASAASRTCCARSSCRWCTCCARPRRRGSSSTPRGSSRPGSACAPPRPTLEREIWELAGEEFMIGSPQQLAEVLFVKLGLSRKRRGKTGFSTDARVLQAIRDEHPIVEKVERWRELTKLVQTYLEQLPAAIGPDGRLHTTLLQTNTATGRLASINPNLQNIPIRSETGREIRACFVAEPGNVLISVDYSQVELRVLAHIAGEDVLKQIFLRGEDVHTETAAAVFDTAPDQLTVAMRSKAKMVNYGIVYGLSAYGLADRLRIEQEEAQEFIDRYLERFPAVAQFMADAVTQAEEHGYVSTLFGRRRQVPEIRARNWQTRKLGERLAVNSIIQGTAADIIKVAMVRCHDALAAAGLSTRVILQIHDELLFEGPEDEAERAAEIASAEMVGAAELDPPLVVDAGIGPNWLAAK